MSFEAEYVEGVLRTESKIEDIKDQAIIPLQYYYALAGGAAFDVVKRNGFYSVKPDQARIEKQAKEITDLLDRMEESETKRYGDSKLSPRLVHGVLGVITEAAELLQMMAEAVVADTDVDRQNLVEELGDLEYYMALIRSQYGLTQEQIQRANKAKLDKRYPTVKPEEFGAARDKVEELSTMMGALTEVTS